VAARETFGSQSSRKRPWLARPWHRQRSRIRASERLAPNMRRTASASRRLPIPRPRASIARASRPMRAAGMASYRFPGSLPREHHAFVLVEDFASRLIGEISRRQSRNGHRPTDELPCGGIATRYCTGIFPQAYVRTRPEKSPAEAGPMRLMFRTVHSGRCRFIIRWRSKSHPRIIFSCRFPSRVLLSLPKTIRA
jgi:hypothetical protein